MLPLAVTKYRNRQDETESLFVALVLSLFIFAGEPKGVWSGATVCDYSQILGQR